MRMEEAGRRMEGSGWITGMKGGRGIAAGRMSNWEPVTGRRDTRDQVEGRGGVEDR